MTNKGMNSKVDEYLAEGCMRCPLGGTPDCKVHNWEEELKKLRIILLDCGLTEELKWSQPCYTYEKRNIVIMSAFKEYCAINFIKGSLLKDANGILIKPGENTQVGRQIKFTNVRDIVKMEPILKEYIYEAIEVEKSGVKPNIKKNPEPIPEELQKKLDEIPAFKTAFEALTPGRQRAYILYFSAPKQSKTKESRIEKYMAKILNGKGLND
ncbi:YdeI/OmpD-associated family protein [Bacillus sp. BRMEA1]|uniref:YdeI/OmpD-associated family protein n=1 Tax=Neobacillus endophyticus TaxID=2738405 RepID=UPI0015653A3B|nr:YdeI/OmpD-associated family protein [Neobacillus endophyticus]NRD79901.1 YdeI/OmpD-associated family protein [Neobacillus endophyticus]